jgi:hypothetical protein
MSMYSAVYVARVFKRDKQIELIRDGIYMRLISIYNDAEKLKNSTDEKEKQSLLENIGYNVEFAKEILS